MSTGTPRQVRLDISELRKFRHRLSGRVQVVYGEQVVSDETVKLDDIASRHDFLQRAIGTLLLTFPDDPFPTLGTLDHQLINLVARAEQDAEDAADIDDLTEERFAVDAEGRITVQLFLRDQPVGAPVVLTNFAANIISDTQVDDGAEVRRVYEIEVVIRGHRSVISVPAEHYPDLGWLGRVGGAEAIVVAGPSRRDKPVKPFNACHSARFATNSLTVTWAGGRFAASTSICTPAAGSGPLAA